jgi:hypothetical protein
VKGKFTYKEFSLLIGIAVALIILLTFWLKPEASEPDNVSIKPTPKISAPAPKTLLKKLVATVQDSVL